MKEGRISNTALRNLCIENNWFTGGDIEQYDKLFQLNVVEAPIEQIATAIWMCSDNWSRRDILLALHKAGFTERRSVTEKKYLQRWLGI